MAEDELERAGGEAPEPVEVTDPEDYEALKDAGVFLYVPFEMAGPVPIEYADLKLEEADVTEEEWIDRLREADAGEWEAPLFHLEDMGYRVEGHPEPGSEVRLVGPERTVVVRFGGEQGGLEPSEVIVEDV